VKGAAVASHLCFWSRGAWDDLLTFRAQQFARHLAEAGYKVSMIVDDVAANRDAALPGVEIRRVPNRPRARSLRRTRSAIRALNPDLVHILNPSLTHMLVLATLPRQRVLADWEDAHTVTQHRRGRRIIDQCGERWALRRADKVIVVSRALQERFAAMGRPNAGYIPYAILPREFPEGPSPFAAPTFVWMGRFTRASELYFLAEAADWLQRRQSPARIMMIGEGPHWEAIQQFKAERGLTNLDLPGRMKFGDPKMLLHLRRARGLLLPLEDNLDNRTRCPFKAFQYAQARRPIIACRVGEVPFMLGEKPRYEPFDPAAFGQAMDELARQGEVADVEYALDQHTWQERTARLIDHLQDAPGDQPWAASG
jgi:glycosyltransferase involved in cell wall biosynthesis